MRRLIPKHLRRLIAAIDNRLPGKRSVNGAPLDFAAPTRRIFSRMFDNDYESFEWQAVNQWCPESGLALDVGANVGVLSLFLARRLGPNGTVLAFEPNPSTFAHLVNNLARNRWANVEPLCAAASETSGAASFYLETSRSLGPGSGFSRAYGDSFNPTTVPVLAIDDLPRPVLDEVVYIKIDVEGAELLVLRGAVRCLRHRRPPVQIEMHGEGLEALGSSVASVFEFMEALGYRAVNLVTANYTDAFQFSRDTAWPYGAALRHAGYGQLIFLPCS